MSEMQEDRGINEIHPNVTEPEIGNVPAGIAAGAVVALIGAAIWGAIAGFTGYEAGIIAWGIGICVGYTVIGIAKLPSNQLAFTASGLAIAGILIGKIFAVYFAGPTALADEWQKDPDTKMEVLLQYMYDEDKLKPEERLIYTKFEEDENYQVDDEEQAVLQELVQRVQEMTPDEERTALKVMGRKVIKEISFTEMVKAQLGPFDILWVVLAIGSAWRLCSEGGRSSRRRRA